MFKHDSIIVGGGLAGLSAALSEILVRMISFKYI